MDRDEEQRRAWRERKKRSRERMREEGELEQVAVVIPRRDHERLIAFARQLRQRYEAERRKPSRDAASGQPWLPFDK